MTVITTSISGREWFKSTEGWTVYTRDHNHMRNQSLAMHEVKGVIDGHASWDQLQQKFRGLRKIIEEKGIKWTIDVHITAERIDICRSGKILPSIWITKD